MRLNAVKIYACKNRNNVVIKTEKSLKIENMN